VNEQIIDRAEFIGGPMDGSRWEGFEPLGHAFVYAVPVRVRSGRKRCKVNFEHSYDRIGDRFQYVGRRILRIRKRGDA
jgi:hypothetical protein